MSMQERRIENQAVRRHVEVGERVPVVADREDESVAAAPPRQIVRAAAPREAIRAGSAEAAIAGGATADRVGTVPANDGKTGVVGDMHGVTAAVGEMVG